MADKLKEILNRGTPTKPAPEPVEDEPEELGECAAIAKSRWVTALTIKHDKKPWETFQYAGIATRSEYEPTKFWVRFVDEDAVWELVVTGRRLWRVYNLIIQKRLEWIQAVSRDFEDGDKPVILTATATKVKEED